MVICVFLCVEKQTREQEESALNVSKAGKKCLARNIVRETLKSSVQSVSV